MSQQGGKKDTYAKTAEPRDISGRDLSFLSRYTGQKDLSKLRAHVMDIWNAAAAQPVFYPCMQHFMFLEQRITWHEHYPQLLAAMRAGQPIRYLEVGVCFGQDMRQLLLDGLPFSSVTVSDVTSDFWETGKALFMDAEKMRSMRAEFGSFLDPGFVTPTGPLGSLVGKVTALWANLVIHVFSKQQVPVFLRHVHSMLAPGGVFMGYTMGSDPPAERGNTPDGGAPRYQHSPASLEAAFRDAGFSQVSIKTMRPTELYPGHSWIEVDDEGGPTRIMMCFTAKK